MKLHDEQKVRDGVTVTPEYAHLSRSGTSIVFAFDVFGLPSVAHWGAALRDEELDGLLASTAPAAMNSSLDLPRSFSIAASRAFGWSGTPALDVHDDDVVIERFELHRVEHDADGVVFTLRDESSSVDAAFAYRLDAAGLLHADIRIDNLTSDRWIDVAAARVLLPLPARAQELLDFTGRWTHEHHPQRSELRDGTWLRSSRRGRPGHDSAFLTATGTRGFRFRSGEVWAAHLAWSGNQEVLVERLPEGAGVHSSVLGAGELLDHGEVGLGPGESYPSPTAVFAWSDRGLDGLTARFHEAIRARPTHPRSPRPLLLNTWEAVYFDHDIDTLRELARVAAEVGVERFVLDDGWFRGRRGDTAGLGDWYVDDTVWPEGLRPLADQVHGLGMQFGLWVEPEMVNPDSDLARAHPDWILGEDPRLESRHQFVLDLAQDEVVAYLVERLDEIVHSSTADFLKWDHNRDLHAATGARGDRRVHAHTLGVYRVFEELRRRHPHLEIESCASGGARADLGILRVTDRVWASDCNDPVERQAIQRWTQTLLPPELIGAHVGPTESHTTHRHADFSFRAITALFGHAGLEWDLTRITAEEKAQVAAWTALYRELRGLLHGGTTVRSDEVDDGALLHGVVDTAQTEAVFAWVRTATSATAHSPRVPIPGLDPAQHYRVRIREEVGAASRHQVADPAWVEAAPELTFTGAVLAQGLPLPVLNPGQAMLLHLTATPAD